MFAAHVVSGPMHLSSRTQACGCRQRQHDGHADAGCGHWSGVSARSLGRGGTCRFLVCRGPEAVGGPGEAVPGAVTRFFLVVSVGPTFLAAVSYGFFCADLPVACASQALIAALLALLLILSAGSVCRKRVTSWRSRRRLRRERRRWHESQRAGTGHVPTRLSRRRPR